MSDAFASPWDSQDKVEPTPQEMEKIMKAFEDPEFRKLFDEYAKEISDPKSREENLAYLQQLERENMVPAGMKLVKPDPGFCLKAKISKTGEKVFVNFCSSSDVENPTSTRQKGGSSWQVPYIMPPNCRHDLDNAEEKCSVFDVVFGPETIKRAAIQQEFQNMIIDVALDGVQKNGKIELSKEFKVLKNIKCRAAPIPALSIRTDKSAPTSTAPPASSSASAAAPPSIASLANNLSTSSVKHASNVTASGTRSSQKSTSAPAASASASSSQVKPAATTSSSALKPTPSAVVQTAAAAAGTMETPVFSMVHRGEFQLQSFTVERAELIGARRPKELVVSIELPKLNSIAGVDLDVSERELRLTAGSTYSLTVPLPYRIDDQSAGAKFDKGAHRLTVTLPLAPLTAAEIDALKLQLKSTEETSSEHKSDHQAEPVSSQQTSPLASSSSSSPANESPVSLSAHEKKDDTKPAKSHHAPSSTSEKEKPTKPQFSFRQTPNAVNLVISVKNVESRSIRSNFTSNSMDFSFTCLSPTRHHQLACNLAGRVIPEKCSYSVSAKNVVIQLIKAEVVDWPQLEGNAVASVSLSPAVSTHMSDLPSPTIASVSSGVAKPTVSYASEPHNPSKDSTSPPSSSPSSVPSKNSVNPPPVPSKVAQSSVNPPSVSELQTPSPAVVATVSTASAVEPATPSVASSSTQASHAFSSAESTGSSMEKNETRSKIELDSIHRPLSQLVLSNSTVFELD